MYGAIMKWHETVVIIISFSQNKIQPVSMEYLDDRSLDGCLPGPE